MGKLAALGAELASYHGLPQQLQSAAHDVILLGQLVDMWCSAMFSVTLPAGVALEMYVAFNLGIFALRKEHSTFNKVWYVTVHLASGATAHRHGS